MRKKAILVFAIVAVLGILSYMGFHVISKAKAKHQIAKQLEYIPEFACVTLAQQAFTKTHLKPNTATVFIYFNSTCNFCQHEAQSISANLDRFKHVQFIFISAESAKTITQFSTQYNLINQPDIIVLQDNNASFERQFDVSAIPYVLIYNANQKLIKKQKGQLNAKGILNALQQNDKGH